MKKHDLLSLMFLLIAGAGAALVYIEQTLAGQITYTVGMMGAALLTKIKGYPWQSWIGLIIAAGFGYVVGDWMISVATACAYLAVTFRLFFTQMGTFNTVNWQEPILVTIALGTYVSMNLLHDNGWQGWTFPAPILFLGSFVGLTGAMDRAKIKKMIESGLIEVGSDAPDFSLENQDGKKVSLSDYKGMRELLLIFVRGDWCPSCHIMLRLYEKERKKFQDKNIMLFAIGPDPVGVNRAMVEKLGVEFAVLSDEKLDITRKYCLHIQEGVGGLENGAPLPASFLVDKQGIIRYTSRSDNAGEFLRPDLIFDVLAKI